MRQTIRDQRIAIDKQQSEIREMDAALTKAAKAFANAESFVEAQNCMLAVTVQILHRQRRHWMYRLVDRILHSQQIANLELDRMFLISTQVIGPQRTEHEVRMTGEYRGPILAVSPIAEPEKGSVSDPASA